MPKAAQVTLGCGPPESNGAVHSRQLESAGSQGTFAHCAHPLSPPSSEGKLSVCSCSKGKRALVHPGDARLEQGGAGGQQDGRLHM